MSHLRSLIDFARLETQSYRFSLYSSSVDNDPKQKLFRTNIKKNFIYSK